MFVVLKTRCSYS